MSINDWLRSRELNDCAAPAIHRDIATDKMARFYVCCVCLLSAVLGAGVDPYACDLRFRVNGGAAHSVPVASAASAAGGRALAARIADAAAAARVDEFSVCASALAGRAEAVAADPVAVYVWPPGHTGVWKHPDFFVVQASAGEDPEGTCEAHAGLC